MSDIWYGKNKVDVYRILEVSHSLLRRQVRSAIDRGDVKIHGKHIYDPNEQFEIRSNMEVEVGLDSRTIL